MSSPEKDLLMSLHSDRIEGAHYIFNNTSFRDTQNVVDYKLYVLLNKIQMIDDRVKTNFMHHYGDLLNHVEQKLVELNIGPSCAATVSKDDKELVDEYWLDE